MGRMRSPHRRHGLVTQTDFGSSNAAIYILLANCSVADLEPLSRRRCVRQVERVPVLWHHNLVCVAGRALSMTLCNCSVSTASTCAVYEQEAKNAEMMTIPALHCVRQLTAVRRTACDKATCAALPAACQAGQSEKGCSIQALENRALVLRRGPDGKPSKNEAEA